MHKINDIAFKNGYEVSRVSWSKLGKNTVYVNYIKNNTYKCVEFIRLRISNHWGGVIGSFNLSCIVDVHGNIKNIDDLYQFFDSLKVKTLEESIRGSINNINNECTSTKE
jgi:hypothetical protein